MIGELESVEKNTNVPLPMVIKNKLIIYPDTRFEYPCFRSSEQVSLMVEK